MTCLWLVCDASVVVYDFSAVLVMALNKLDMFRVKLKVIIKQHQKKNNNNKKNKKWRYGVNRHVSYDFTYFECIHNLVEPKQI